jgi:hypothetical protein
LAIIGLGLALPGAAARAEYDNPILRILDENNCRLLRMYEGIDKSYTRGVDKEDQKHESRLAKLQDKLDQALADLDFDRADECLARIDEQIERHQARLDALLEKRDAKIAALDQRVQNFLDNLDLGDLLGGFDFGDLF